MYENRHGRFTAVDPLLASGKSSDPQSFNRYVYVRNAPLLMTDPTGLIGDFYDSNGNWLGHDGKKDGRVYFARLMEDRGAEVDLYKDSIRETTWAAVHNAARDSAPAADPIQDLVQSTGGNLSDAITGMGIGARNTLTGGVNSLTNPLGPAGAAAGVPNPLAIAPLESGNARQAAYAFLTETGINAMASAGAGAAFAGPTSAGSALRVTPTGFTRSYAGLGQKMHAEFMFDQQIAGQAIKEFRLPSGKRIDFLDIPNSTIYELKPFNPNAIAAGRKQLQIYKTELEAMPRFQGIQWNTRIRTY